MTNETIYQFATEVMATHSFEHAKDLVMRVILAADENRTLVEAAFAHVNDEFFQAALNGNSSNHSELV